jgi:hypothetical protein
VRVNSDKQTLILAGEFIPRRDPAAAKRLTIVATRADTTMLLAQGDTAQEPSGDASLMTLARADYTTLARSHLDSARGSSSSAANAYARTQELSANGRRTAIIDTYA